MTARTQKTEMDLALFFNSVVECASMRAVQPPTQWTAEKKLRYETLRVAGEEALGRLICPFEPDPPRTVAKSQRLR